MKTDVHIIQQDAKKLRVSSCSVTIDEVVDFLTETVTTTQITLPIIVNDIRKEFPDISDVVIGAALLKYCSYV